MEAVEAAARRLVGARQRGADHDRVRAAGDRLGDVAARRDHPSAQQRADFHRHVVLNDEVPVIHDAGDPRHQTSNSSRQ